MVLVEPAFGPSGSARALPTSILMTTRGSQLVEAHIRSFDPETPTARERLEAALGEPFARELLRAVRESREGPGVKRPLGARVNLVVSGRKR